MIEFLQREKIAMQRVNLLYRLCVISVYLIVYFVVVFVFSYQSIMWFGLYRVIGGNTRVMISLNEVIVYSRIWA